MKVNGNFKGGGQDTKNQNSHRKSSMTQVFGIPRGTGRRGGGFRPKIPQ